jgi:hypothetical protein
MFYHDNGKLKVFANTRCGNTNMRHYFNIDADRQKHFPTAYSNELIIVLRNPLDRVVSAVKGIPKILAALPLVDTLSNRIGKDFSKEFVDEFVIFYLHCNPFLYKIVDKPFRIIDFDKLVEYIPRKTGLFQSPVTNSKGHTDPKAVYVQNTYFSLSDLEKEYALYCKLLNDREHISISEWKEKTT